MNKFIIIEGGVQIGYISVITELTLKELANTYCGLETISFESTANIGEIAVVIIDEETSLYIVNFQESLFQALNEDSVESMDEVEELIGLEY